MTAAEFLKQYRDKVSSIERITAEISRLYDRAESMPVSYCEIKRTNKANYDWLGDTVSRIADLENKRAEMILEAWEIRNNIGLAINELENPEYNRLLYDRYIAMLPWKDIAAGIGKDFKYVMCRMHVKALEALEKQLQQKTG